MQDISDAAIGQWEMERGAFTLDYDTSEVIREIILIQGAAWCSSSNYITLDKVAAHTSKIT